MSEAEFEAKAKELITDWVWARARTVILPVFASVLVTQGGAAFFVPDHVKAAVASEVKPAKDEAEKLTTGTKEAYHSLALAMNAQSEVVKTKAPQSEVDVLRERIKVLRKELKESVIAIEALQTFVRDKHGNNTFQRYLDSVDGVKLQDAPGVDEKKPELPKLPTLPTEFDVYLKGKETKNGPGNPHDRQD